MNMDEGGGLTDGPVDERQVQVKFTTKLPPQMRVAATPFAVPARLSRYGLSEVINTLLGHEKPQPFDFLVDGELLRTSLEKFLLTRKLSAETTLTIEYLTAVVPPKPRDSRPHDDWVSAVSGALPKVVLTGSYDSMARVWLNGVDCRCTLAGHTEAVTAVVPLEAPHAPDGNVQLVVTSSKDRTLRLWEVPAGTDELREGTTVAASKVFRGHSASVQSVAASPSGQEICSGSWDTSIRIWPTAGDPDDVDGGQAASTKKQRVNGTDAVPAAPTQVSPRAVLQAHSQCVAAVVWAQPGALFSGSWDHSIRCWDSATGTNTQTLTGSKPVHCLSAGGEGGALLAAGGADNVLRVWDPRLASAVTPVKQLTSHKGWISAVKWSPRSAHHLLSASYDGSLKLWDLRSPVPLHTLEAHPDKALCADWWGEGIVSGGADCQLRVYSSVANV